MIVFAKGHSACKSLFLGHLAAPLELFMLHLAFLAKVGDIEAADRRHFVNPFVLQMRSHVLQSLFCKCLQACDCWHSKLDEQRLCVSTMQHPETMSVTGDCADKFNFDSRLDRVCLFLSLGRRPLYKAEIASRWHRQLQQDLCVFRLVSFLFCRSSKNRQCCSGRNLALNLTEPHNKRSMLREDFVTSK